MVSFAKMLAFRLVRSKLRKRGDEPSNQETAATATVASNNESMTTTATSTEPAAIVVASTKDATEGGLTKGDPLYSSTPMFLWQYPPRYSNDQETLVQNLPMERPGFCRGFRKNLRGRWRRLVRRKPAQEVYTIPAELRDQLKQIYVY